MNYIFDLGQVLVAWDPYSYFGRYFEDRRETDWLFENLFTSEWRDRSDIYVTVEENVRILALRNPLHADLIDQWNRDFFSIMHGLNEENWSTVELLQQGGRKVYGLANFARDKYAEALQKFPQLKTLDGIVVSSQVGFRKPEHGIYMRACGIFGIEAAESVFIDDSIANVAAARECGMIGYLYTCPKKLRSYVESVEKKT